MSTGQIAYEAYCRKAGGRSLVSGDRLPAWDDLSPEIQEAWEAASVATPEPLDGRAQARIPGVKARHAIIRPQCQQTHGSAGAFRIAAGLLKDEYHRIVEGWGDQQPAIHLVLTIERPPATGGRDAT